MSHIGSGFFDKVPWDRLASDGPRLAAKFGQDVHPRPIILTLLVVLLGLSLGLMFVTWTVNAVDRDALRRQQQFASEGLQAIIAQVPKDQESITIWDDSLVRADARDTQWMAENIGEWVGSYFGHDQVYVLGSDNEVIYAMVGGVTVNAAASDEVYDLMRPLADRLRQHVSSVARSHSQDPPALGKLGAMDIGLISGIPSVISVKPIVPSTRSSFSSLALGTCMSRCFSSMQAYLPA